MARTWIQVAGMVETMRGSSRDVENWFFGREFEDFPRGKERPPVSPKLFQPLGLATAIATSAPEPAPR